MILLVLNEINGSNLSSWCPENIRENKLGNKFSVWKIIKISYT